MSEQDCLFSIRPNQSRCPSLFIQNSTPGHFHCFITAPARPPQSHTATLSGPHWALSKKGAIALPLWAQHDHWPAALCGSTSRSAVLPVPRGEQGYGHEHIRPSSSPVVAGLFFVKKDGVFVPASTTCGWTSCTALITVAAGEKPCCSLLQSAGGLSAIWSVPCTASCQATIGKPRCWLWCFDLLPPVGWTLSPTTSTSLLPLDCLHLKTK